MAGILDLKVLASFADGDFLPVYETVNTDARKVSLQTLREFIQTNISPYVKRYQRQEVAVPVDAYTVEITNNQKSTWVFLTGFSTYHGNTITFQMPADPIDQQEVRIYIPNDCAMAVDGNGHDVIGEVILSEDVTYESPILYKYCAEVDAWYLLLGITFAI